MKYKLINKKSCSKNGVLKEGESCRFNNNCTYPNCCETICDKVTIDGFNYYVSDGEINQGDYYIDFRTDGNKLEHFKEKDDWVLVGICGSKKVIATNNPNIDIPKVGFKIDLTKLCYYDRRNPDFSIKEEYGYDKEEVEATGNFAKKDCACDNCFYGRSALTEQLIKSQETHPFSEEDMIDFAEFYFREEFNSTMQDCKPSKELLQLWKKQKPKTLYYE